MLENEDFHVYDAHHDTSVASLNIVSQHPLLLFTLTFLL